MAGAGKVLTVLLLGAAVSAVPLVPQKYGRPPVASPTDAGLKYVHGKRFDENGNEISLNLNHRFETRRLTENSMEGFSEFEAAVNPEVNAIAWDGVEGHTTYLLSLDLPEHSDAENVYSIHGTTNHPLTLPPAHQVAPPFGSVYGGVNPKLIELRPESEFDSWLTLGITTGPGTFTGASMSMIGLDLESWSDTQGLGCDDCAMFYMDPSMGPTLEDRDGPSGPRTDRGEIVVAQITVPSEGSYTVTMNAQGKTKGWQLKDDLQSSNWSEEDITFTFGDALQSGTHTEPPPPPPTSGIEYESAAVTGHVLTVSTDAIEGHSTFRLALRLQGDARNVYTIYGQTNHPMTMPPAFQTLQPFGADVGGVNPIIYTQDVPGAAFGEFDSWLTVGETEGSTSELSNVGIWWPSWTDSNPLEVIDGAIFWMQPDHGPSNQDCDGAQGPANSGGDIVVAQLTVPNDHTFSAVVNAQGDRMTKSDGSWNEMDIEFTFGHTTASVGPCTMQAAIANPYKPQCNAAGGFLALQCWQKDHCFCADETGRPLPRDRLPVHAAGGSFYTEAACLTARDMSSVASDQPSMPTQGGISDQVTVSHGQVNEQITIDLEWMSPDERDALADSNSAGYAAAVQSLRVYLAHMLNVPESEVRIEEIIAQLDGVDETRTPSTGSTLEGQVTHPVERRRSCLRTLDTTYQECSNAGTCTDTQEHIADRQAGESHCDCGLSNWGGPFCEEWDTVDNCQETTCGNGFQCVDLFGHAICATQPASQPPPVCEGRCQNGGVCNGVGEMARCDCPADYDGVYCTEHDAVDQCASSPCLNNGSCHDLFGEFFCECDADHSGRHCEMTVEEDRNDCEPGGSVQCENGGTCIDLFQSFSCICRTGFHGPNCHERYVAETPTPAPEVIVVEHPQHNAGETDALSKRSQNNSATHHAGGRRGFTLVMFFLVAGFAAVGIVAYRQRTDALSRASIGDDLGKARLQGKHGSVYENTLYGHMGASVSDGSHAQNAARTGLQPACMLDKAKALASKAGANGVRSTGPSGARSIYDVGTSDGL